ncbi:hypothetical protein BDR07DRAFT_254209 [Suillus spraguei]|nr:hypothetical protein BDR07DRAFT_254209 [Suillus spraguei]
MTLLSSTIILLIHIPFVYSSLPSLNGTSVIILDINDTLPNNTRSLWNIIWSCAATLFACTWTAIHPNIPGTNEGRFTVLFRRLGIMMTALIAPETIITWATIQFLSARSTAEAFNVAFSAQLHQARDHPDMEESTATFLNEFPASGGRDGPHPNVPYIVGNFTGWTVTHGFFAWMGGFMLYFDDNQRATLTPDELLDFLREGSVDLPVIAEEDIEDRSKGDALSKGIAILQLAWFILQLVARYVQNLPITLLELDTLAVAALTGIVYGFWWKKPKDVGRPQIIYWKATTSPPSELTYNQVNAIFSNRDSVNLLLTYIYPIPSLMGIGIFNSPRTVHSRRVPSAGGYDRENARRHRVIILLIGSLSGAVFGSIHCLGWNVLFQGHTEQILWRAASLAIVSSPLCIFLLNTYAIRLDHFWLDRFWLDRSWLNCWSNIVEAIAFLAILASFFTYAVARITVIVLVLMSFRSLPPGVYDAVSWTKFIPHL